MLLMERDTVSPDPARESLWCAAGWRRLEKRKDRRHTQLLNSLNSTTVSEDTIGIMSKSPLAVQQAHITLQSQGTPWRYV